jgi:hypothetical protein
MDETKKMETAEVLAASIRKYGAIMILDAKAKGYDGAEPRVAVRMRDGMAYNLPWDFNPEHLDAVFAIAAAARIKGREEASLEGFEGNSN